MRLDGISNYTLLLRPLEEFEMSYIYLVKPFSFMCGYRMGAGLR
jgi:hypothetical protein